MLKQHIYVHGECVCVCVWRDGGGGGWWKYSWHNIIGGGPYGKLAASYLSLSSLEAKISTSLFVALSWTPTTVIGLIIKKKKKKKKKPSWHNYPASSTSSLPSFSLSLASWLSLSVSASVSLQLSLRFCQRVFLRSPYQALSRQEYFTWAFREQNPANWSNRNRV